MFEGIGRRDDREDRKRQAQSALLTTLLCAAGAGFWVGIAAWHLGDEPIAAVEDDDEIEYVELALAEPDTPLPEAPAPAIVQKGEPDPEPTPTPEPSPDATPDTLEEPPRNEVASTSGDPAGSSDGDPEGTLDGREHGTGDGPGDGPPGFGDAHAVHVGELRWKRRPAPDWPSEATGLGIQEASCLADVVFADTGEPVSVTIRGCPNVFHQDTRAAILGSRLYPFEVEGRKVTVKSTIRVRYVLR